MRTPQAYKELESPEGREGSAKPSRRLIAKRGRSAEGGGDLHVCETSILIFEIAGTSIDTYCLIQSLNISIRSLSGFRRLDYR